MNWQKHFDIILKSDWGSKESVDNFEILMSMCSELDHISVVFDTWQRYLLQKIFHNKDYEIFKEIADLNSETLENNNYHNCTHISQVLLTSLLFWEKSNLPLHTLKPLYFSALGHDTLHNGIGNKEGAFELETIASEKIKSILLNYNVPSDDIILTESLILATEANYRKALTTNSNELNVKQFNHLFTSPTYIELARIISDADLFCSTGLGIDLHMEQTFKIMSEMKVIPSKRYDISVYFLKEIVGHSFISNVGRAFNKQLEELHSYYETDNT